MHIEEPSFRKKASNFRLLNLLLFLRYLVLPLVAVVVVVVAIPRARVGGPVKRKSNSLFKQ